MKRRTHHSPLTTHARRSLTLAEAAVSVVIVGVMLVSSLNAVARTKLNVQKQGDLAVGALLAQELMSEIMELPYADPDVITLVLGPEAGESAATRASFDDVDDYDNWTSGPQKKDGTVIPGRTGWEQQVRVQLVDAANIQLLSLLDEGIKRVTVTILHNGLVTATWVGVRTDPLLAPVISASILNPPAGGAQQIQ